MNKTNSLDDMYETLVNSDSLMTNDPSQLVLLRELEEMGLCVSDAHVQGHVHADKCFNCEYTYRALDK